MSYYDTDANMCAAKSQTTGNLGSLRIPTGAERHEIEAKGHYEQASRHERAAIFLKLHPEFAEFIELRNQGIL